RRLCARYRPVADVLPDDKITDMFFADSRPLQGIATDEVHIVFARDSSESDLGHQIGQQQLAPRLEQRLQIQGAATPEAPRMALEGRSFQLSSGNVLVLVTHLIEVTGDR